MRLQLASRTAARRGGSGWSNACFAGRIFRGQGHNVLDDRRRVERLAAGRAGFVAQQPAEALAHEPLLPAPHDGFGAPVPRMIALVPSPSAVSKMMFARQT